MLVATQKYSGYVPVVVEELSGHVTAACHLIEPIRFQPWRVVPVKQTKDCERVSNP